MQKVESKLAEFRSRARSSKANSSDKLPLLNLITKKSNPDSCPEEKRREDDTSSQTVAFVPNIAPHSGSYKAQNDNNAVSTKKAMCPRTNNVFYSYIENIVGYNKLTFMLKLMLWLLLFGLFVELEFGAVFFVTSVFYGIYLNMRSGLKKDGAPSAYSVFNPDCERIDGTFTTEQFERELRYGAAAVGET